MRALLAILSLLCLLIGDAATASAAGHARTRTKKAVPTGPESIQFVYDYTIPWPFRRHHQAMPGDTDGDGVSDDLDKCPGTPGGAHVDADGCPSDADGDGVFDGIDKCPETPKGARVDARGCPTDSDGDGVYDGIDTCPATPKGATVDTQGCPSDADGDGVFDGIDRCANTPANTAVDENGCPKESTKTEMEFLDTGMIRTSQIKFASDRSDLKPESNKVLDEIGTVLVQWPELQVEIGGHTDSQGSDAHNATLSEARANAVRDYLLDKFPKIDKNNLSIKGYGEGTPIASNDTADGRAKNRRVEFTVLNKETLQREIERKGLKKR